MLLMVADGFSRSTRGELTRWLLEVVPGVFVGHASALVRDQLWAYFTSRNPDAWLVQAWSSNNEQGYQIRTFGAGAKQLVDFDGIQLFAVRDAAWTEAAGRFRLVRDVGGLRDT